MEDTERGSLGRGAWGSKGEKERTNQHKRQEMALSCNTLCRRSGRLAWR